MKLSILAKRTSTPFSRPMARPMPSTSRQTRGQGAPPTISPMARECSRLTMKPTERSNWLAEMTVISANARKATMDLSDRIDCAVSMDGKVLGRRKENNKISATVSSSSA